MVTGRGSWLVGLAFVLAAANALAQAAASMPASAEAPSASGAPSASFAPIAPTAPSAAPAPSAQPAPVRQETVPELHHAPISVAVAHEDLLIEAAINHPELVRRAVVGYVSPDGSIGAAEFRRGVEGPYVAVIPADVVRAPWIAYFLFVDRVDGRHQSVFASPDRPHRVRVPESRLDLYEAALGRQLDARRSVFSARAEYVNFGSSEAEEWDPTLLRTVTRSVPDWFYRVEAAYTYRPLRTVTEFSLRVGVVRGKSPVPVAGRSADTDRFKVGLNYGAPTVRLRLADTFHMEGEFLTSVTEVGFSVGGGGAVLIGNPYATQLVLGVESIEVFGTRVYSRLDILARRGWLLSPIIEATDMPHANKFGVRLLGETSVELGAGFSLAARAGYQARRYTSGGASVGLMLGYGF